MSWTLFFWGMAAFGLFIHNIVDFFSPSPSYLQWVREEAERVTREKALAMQSVTGLSGPYRTPPTPCERCGR